MALRHKVAAWPRFCASLAAYEMVPAPLIKPVAGTLVFAEAIVIIGLIFAAPMAFALAAALFSLYLVAIAVNMIRGRTHIDCGCGDVPTGLTHWLLVRNISLVLIAFWGIASDTAFSPLVLLIGLGFSSVALLLYLALDQMVSNYGLHRRLYVGDL